MVSAGFFQSILGVILGVGMCSHVIGSVITSLASVRPAIKTPQYPPVSAGGYGPYPLADTVSAGGYGPYPPAVTVGYGIGCYR